MGSVISKATDSIGGYIGNVFTAPFKSIFTGSCEDVCAGAWDFVCFVEHLCVSNLVKLVLILGLCYILLLFLYVLFKLGIFQCIVRSLCKICWSACETYWYIIQDITCCIWYKLKNTKRVYRRRPRHRDIKIGYTSSSSPENNYLRRRDSSNVQRKRKAMKTRHDQHHHHLDVVMGDEKHHHQLEHVVSKRRRVR